MMFAMGSKSFGVLALVTAGLLSGCAYDGGYGGVGVGAGFGSRGYYDDGYYGGYGDPYYGGFASYGWFGDYYYPGTGYYVFDRGGHRHRWNDEQRRHWEGRQDARRDGGDGRGDGHRYVRGGRSDLRNGAARGSLGERRLTRAGNGVPDTAGDMTRRSFRADGGAGRAAIRADHAAAREAAGAQRVPNQGGGQRGFSTGGRSWSGAGGGRWGGRGGRSPNPR